MVEEGLRIELDLARWRCEPARRAVRTRVGMLGVTGMQLHPHAAGSRAQLLQRDAGRSQLMTIGGLEVTIPELRGKAESGREIEDDLGIRTRFTGWRHKRRAKLDQRLRLLADL